jgi:hypothetical protein
VAKLIYGSLSTIVSGGIVVNPIFRGREREGKADRRGDSIEPSPKVKTIYEFGEILKEMEEKGIWLFGLRTTCATTLPTRDGTGKPFDAKVANFHLAYADSKKVIVLNARH